MYFMKKVMDQIELLWEYMSVSLIEFFNDYSKREHMARVRLTPADDIIGGNQNFGMCFEEAFYAESEEAIRTEFEKKILESGNTIFIPLPSTGDILYVLIKKQPYSKNRFSIDCRFNKIYNSYALVIKDNVNDKYGKLLIDIINEEFKPYIILKNLNKSGIFHFAEIYRSLNLPMENISMVFTALNQPERLTDDEHLLIELICPEVLEP